METICHLGEQDGGDDDGGSVWMPPALGESEEGGKKASTPELSKRDRRRLLTKPRWYQAISKNISKSSKKLYHQLWPQYGLEAPEWGSCWHVPSLLQRQDARLVIEVGFGGGDCLAALASRAHKRGLDVLFLGVEWHRASVVNCMKRLHEADLGGSNVKIYAGDFVRLLGRKALPEQSVDEIMVFFPDPWPKTRGEARRVIRPEVMELLTPLVKPGGYLHVATDVREYAAWVGAVLEKEEGWEACCTPTADSVVAGLLPEEGARELYDPPSRGIAEEEDPSEEGGVVGDDRGEGGGGGGEEEPEGELVAYGLLTERPRWRPVTTYERRGIEVLKHSIYDLCFRRVQR